MKWTVDRLEEDIAVLINDTTEEIKEVKKSILPSSIHEGSILNYINNEYIEDTEDEKNRRQSIQDRFNKLKKQ